MKKYLLSILLVILFLVVACSEPIEMQPTNTPYPTYTPYPTNTPYPTYTPFVPFTSTEIIISEPETRIRIHFPSNYMLIENVNEPNRRGSFVSYNFLQVGEFLPSNDAPFTSLPPYFYEIQFFTPKSIENFVKRCATEEFISPELLCYKGNHPDLTTYSGQKEAFYNRNDYENYSLERFKNEYYFTSTKGCIGGYCQIREYTMFIKEIKIDIWILLHPLNTETQIEKSDYLINLLHIELID